ncbi:hypothetical protein C4D60_Mb04t29600 [Musa balbisiana]|uniref:Uncharacterized protein n=1 Tax=Musa balbisiana TaxID=52838 RepID=A0A4S8KFR6_MUSBA|nr:hypothetical protein C4D60_Mb04t29600 [Musa balbisiana]
MASHDNRRRRGLAVLAFVASMFWMLASQSICDGRVLNYSIDQSLWLLRVPQGPASPSARSVCSTPGGMKICNPPVRVRDSKPQSPVTVAVSTPP